ncbi:hypothetical protein M8818_003044 [Zalaria obscura]|uniref:Uncharacterized protein n=1 Tax=Zalaria obscura TaxID=2024903 RepID=A0ACC3SK80_9PEZI
MNSIISDVYIPALKLYYPSGFEEMQGIADGSEVTLEDVVLLNSRYDLARLGDTPGIEPVSTDQGLPDGEDIANECTSAVLYHEATPTGEMITAQNWDMSARLWENDCILYLEVHPDPSENKPSMFLVTEAGQLGRSGMNSAGMGVTANSLMSTDDYIPVPYRDAHGTLHQKIRAHAQKGQLSTERLIESLADHMSYPEALCVHPDRNPVDAVIEHLPGYPFRSNSATVACVIYNLTRKEIKVCKGPPCQGDFQTFKLEGPKGNKIGSQKLPEQVDRPEHP